MVAGKSVDYDQDYSRWIEQTVELLKARRFDELDVENLIDELESMSKRDRREIVSRLKVLLMHLLKWRYQPARRCASWEITIRNQREEIAQILQDSPSLKSYPAAVLEQAYDSARQNAASETGLGVEVFPGECEWAIADILDEAFLPENEE
jgi:Domain of unknown function DUF29